MTKNPVLSALAQSWLSTYCEREAGVKSAVVMLGGEAALQEAAHWPGQVEANASLVAAARAAVKRKSTLVLTPPVSSNLSGDPERIISLPLTNSGGALAVAVQAMQEPVERRQLQEFERAAAGLAAALEESTTPLRSRIDTMLLQLQARLLAPQPLQQSATALASDLAIHLRFERVSLALIANRELTVVALSHAIEVRARHGLVRALANAMQEAIDQATSIVYPPPADTPPRIVHAHMALA
ncbi:MAG TPA: hypothetical protein VFA81_07585, partial [Burkholderiales bacterium]|nr:hypothetical protein [Burkholderiales bacterium]